MRDKAIQVLCLYPYRVKAEVSGCYSDEIMRGSCGDQRKCVIPKKQQQQLYNYKGILNVQCSAVLYISKDYK